MIPAQSKQDPEVPISQSQRVGFAHHLTTTVIAQAVNLVLGVFTGVLVARLLGPMGRGELAALILWPTTLIFFAAMGINQALVFYTGRKNFTLSELWTASTVVGLGQSALTFLAGCIIIPIALRHYPHGVQILALAVLASSPFIILGGYPGNLLQGRLDLNSFNLIQLAAPFVYASSVAILAILHGVNLRSVVTWRIASYVSAFIVAYLLLRKTAKFSIHWNAAACSSLLRFGGKTQLGNISNYVNRSVDQLVLSIFVPPRDLGLYVVAVTVSLALNFFPQAAGIVTLASGSSTNAAGAIGVVGRSLRTCLLWLIIGCAILFLLAPTLIVRVFGTAYSGSVLPCRILLPGAVAVGLNQILYDGARAMGDPSLASYSEGCAVLVTLICLSVLLPWLGFVGAAIASTLAYWGSFCVALALYKWRFGVNASQLFFLSRASSRA